MIHQQVVPNIDHRRMRLYRTGTIPNNSGSSLEQGTNSPAGCSGPAPGMSSLKKSSWWLAAKAEETRLPQLDDGNNSNGAFEVKASCDRTAGFLLFRSRVLETSPCVVMEASAGLRPGG